MMAALKTLAKLLLGRGSFRSYSQGGEDGILRSLIGQRSAGLYIDVGAYHPHLYSNTYALYKMGWYGLAIDPNPRMALLFKLFRPRDTFVCAGIGEGELTYRAYEDGAYNGFTPTDRSRLIGEWQVKLKSLASLVKEHNIDRIDFLNIDTEGLDLAVLESHDWSIPPTLISIEAEVGSPAERFLQARGYDVVARTHLNLIFKLVR